MAGWSWNPTLSELKELGVWQQIPLLGKKKNASISLIDKDMILALTEGLPETYSSLIVALDSIPPNDLTLANVMSSLGCLMKKSDKILLQMLNWNRNPTETQPFKLLLCLREGRGVLKKLPASIVRVKGITKLIVHP